MYQRYGSIRVIATLAVLKGLLGEPHLSFPLQSLKGEGLKEAQYFLQQIEEIERQTTHKYVNELL